jgi:hypothetical protein
MLRNWSSGTWSKASGRATVELDQMRTRFLYRCPLTHSTSGVTQEPLQGSFIWLCGAPEIPISTENSESMQKFSDLSCPAVVSRAWSHLSRRFFHGSPVGFAAATQRSNMRMECAKEGVPINNSVVAAISAAARMIIELVR